MTRLRMDSRARRQDWLAHCAEHVQFEIGHRQQAAGEADAFGLFVYTHLRTTHFERSALSTRDTDSAHAAATPATTDRDTAAIEAFHRLQNILAGHAREALTGSGD